MRPVLLRLAGDSRGWLLLRDAVGERRAETVMVKARAPAPSDRDVGSGGSFVHVDLDDANRMATAISSDELSPLLPFEAVVERLNELQPRLVVSFGSFADHFFRSLEESGYRVHIPRVWDYTGDGISPGAKELAEERGCKLHSSYLDL